MNLLPTFTITSFSIALLWLMSAFSGYIGYTYLLQLKEYRIDRLKGFFHSREGHTFLLRPDQMLGSFFAFGVFTLFYDSKHIVLVVMSLLCLHILYTVYQIVITIKFRRPAFTAKALIIIFGSIALEALVLLFAQKINIILIVFVFRVILLIIVTTILNGITIFMKRQYIYRATKKLATYPNLTVVGITGSYGKSSVKEFLAHILKAKHTVVKTKGNINTEIGIARFILSHDFSKDDVFICEMGAYCIGEIKVMCDMVKPTIGILTAINQQHLALFGSIKNIQKTKYELLQSIPKKGLVVTNADNPYCTEFLDTLTCKKIHTFGTDEDNNPDCLVTNIKAKLNGTSYEGTCLDKRGVLDTPVIGAHHAYNIAAAILVAVYLKIDKEQIIQRSKTLPKNIHGSLRVYTYGKATIIDDSYNSNPTGFRAALDVFAKYPSEKKRIVITRGMLELADESAEIHEQIGGEIAFVADTLVVITENSYKALKRGVGNKYHTEMKRITNPQELLAYIKNLKQ